MENPIQYCNTDNPSQIGRGASHNKGGVNDNAFIVMISPPPGHTITINKL